jgi:uncharacterized protein YjbI with pentapeptide repeats
MLVVIAGAIGAALVAIEISVREAEVKRQYERLSGRTQRLAMLNLTAGCPHMAENRWGHHFVGTQVYGLERYVLERLYGNCRSLSRKALAPLDLRRVNFALVNLSWADLHETNFNQANLTSAHLKFTNLRQATFKRADLRSANLESADLRQANFRRADLSRANLRFANLQGTNFNRTTMTATLFTGSLSNASFRRSILLGSDLRLAQLNRGQIQGKNAPFLCNVALPSSLLRGRAINPNRDCDRIPRILLRRHPQIFKTLQEAKAHVAAIRKWRWEEK